MEKFEIQVKTQLVKVQEVYLFRFLVGKRERIGQKFENYDFVGMGGI